MKALKGTINTKISNEKGHCKVVLINHVQHRIQPTDISSTFTFNRPTTNVMETWSPPQTEHILIPCDVDPPSSSLANCNTSQQRYPLCYRQPPDCLYTTISLGVSFSEEEAYVKCRLQIDSFILIIKIYCSLEIILQKIFH